MEQEKEIQRIIVDKTPEQLRFKERMWTRDNIRQTIKEKCRTNIKLSTLGYYLAGWGFTVQRPVKRAYKQDAKKIHAWLNSEFPEITARAEEKKRRYSLVTKTISRIRPIIPEDMRPRERRQKHRNSKLKCCPPFQSVKSSIFCWIKTA